MAYGCPWVVLDALLEPPLSWIDLDTVLCCTLRCCGWPPWPQIGNCLLASRARALCCIFRKVLMLIMLQLLQSSSKLIASFIIQAAPNRWEMALGEFSILPNFFFQTGFSPTDFFQTLFKAVDCSPDSLTMQSFWSERREFPPTFKSWKIDKLSPWTFSLPPNRTYHGFQTTNIFGTFERISI